MLILQRGGWVEEVLMRGWDGGGGLERGADNVLGILRGMCPGL